MFAFNVHWGKWVPFFVVFVSVSVQVLHCTVALAYVCGSVTGSVFHQSVYIQVHHLMLGHRADVCASHVMLCASYACVFITLDASRIVLNVFCIVCAAWASFDACASHVELSAPWVTFMRAMSCRDISLLLLNDFGRIVFVTVGTILR